jgi:type IV pilus assembly protein PilA
MNQEPKKKFPVWIIIVLALIPVGVAALGILAALAVFGVKKYMTSAKTAEGVHVAGAIANRVARCASEQDESGKRRGLPETSPAVPASLSDVAGVKYKSAPAEWSAPAFTCAGFVLTDPQYFQYQWVRADESSGVVRAVADLDGDGAPDVGVESRIECSPAGQCTAVSPSTSTP